MAIGPLDRGSTARSDDEAEGRLTLCSDQSCPLTHTTYRDARVHETAAEPGIPPLRQILGRVEIGPVTAVVRGHRYDIDPTTVARPVPAGTKTLTVDNILTPAERQALATWPNQPKDG